MAAVFGPRQDAESENADATQTLIQALCRLVLSLVTFFAPAKKVTRLQAKAFDFALQRKEQDQTLSRCRASQRNEPKKRAFPDVSPAQASSCIGIFGLAIPWLGPKTAAIHGGRPPGVRTSSGAAGRTEDHMH
jgi:hypothetical protein